MQRTLVAGFAVAFLLYVLPQQAYAKEEVLVTCGSLIKLQHSSTKSMLHSHEVSYQYGSGSGQQSVTGYPDSDDAGSYWTVRGLVDSPCVPGTPLQGGTAFRLQHKVTSRWLHSHHFQSPISRKQEVSAFGDDTTSDTGDVWILEMEGGTKANGKKAWEKDVRLRLRHKDTDFYLADSARKYGRPIAGQTEICAVKNKQEAGWWRATEGVYFPPREGAQEL